MSWLEIAQVARAIWVLWLMLIFVAIAFTAFRPKNRQHFRDCAQIPFTTDPDESK